MASVKLLDERKVFAKEKNKDYLDMTYHKDGFPTTPLFHLQQTIGNRVLQRLLAQRSRDSFSELDDDTVSRIKGEHGSGQNLDSNLRALMGRAMSQDFGDVKIHTSPEANALSEQLSAKAFTIGSDIFFRQGAYNPGSSSGQELLAHELTHVIQQRSGMISDGSERMIVNAPGDAFEQQADSVAKAVMSLSAVPAVQRQSSEEEEENIRR